MCPIVKQHPHFFPSMNFLDSFFVLLFTVFAFVLTMIIFRFYWQTPYGTRIAFLDVQQKWLLAPLFLILILSGYSLYDYGMFPDHINTMSQFIGGAILTASIISLCMWCTSPPSLSIPIDTMIWHYFPDASRLNTVQAARYITTDSFRNDVFRTYKKVETKMVINIYIEYLRSIGQKVDRKQISKAISLDENKEAVFFTTDEIRPQYIVHDHEIAIVRERSKTILIFGDYPKA
jgi:hypothetical protein